MTVDRDPGHFQRDCLVQFDDISLERERYAHAHALAHAHAHASTRTRTRTRKRKRKRKRKRTDCGSWLRPQPAPHLGP